MFDVIVAEGDGLSTQKKAETLLTMNNKLENTGEYEILGEFKVPSHNGQRGTDVQMQTSFSVWTIFPE